jgi:hypothetical protein
MLTAAKFPGQKKPPTKDRVFSKQATYVINKVFSVLGLDGFFGIRLIKITRLCR